MTHVIDGVILTQIAGFPGYYVSKDGRVWSERQSGKWLKPSKSTSGYLTVGLRRENRRHRLFVHRLVACAWVPNPENKKQVNHIDENKLNNNSSNLEWCDARYNSNYGTRNERISKPVINLATGDRYASTLEAARKTGIANSSICEVCNHNPRRHTAGGFAWAYESEVL